jgi:alpha-1,6-mannosyltransferase
MPSLADSLVLLFISAYLFTAPFTKVEESFNTQAIHDLIHHGLNLEKFDHIEFPGPVPRTFVGSVVLAVLSKAILHFIPKTFSKLDGQLISRGILGTINAFMICYVKDCAFRALKMTYKQQKDHTQKNTKIDKSMKGKYKTRSDPYNPWSFGLWFILFQIGQFHIPFYASRCLPNYMILPLTNYAFGQLFKENYTTAITVLSFAAIVFRIELAALVIALSLVMILYNKITIPQLIRSGLKGAIAGAVLSGVVDSFFWRRFTIPELESFVFNVIDGRSSEWGIEPYYTYFTRHLIAIFIPPHVLVLAVLGYFNDPTKGLLKISAMASIGYIAILSIQPHKELRFIIYTAPIFTILGANGAASLTSKFAKSILCKLIVLLTLFLSIISLTISVVWGEVSSCNYPGGYAFVRFHEMIVMRKLREELSKDPVVLHIGTAACMTGVTHFGELTDMMDIDIIYDRTETPTLEQWKTFDYIITDIGPKDYAEHAIPHLEGWDWVRRAPINGYAGLDLKAFSRLNPENIFGNIRRTKSLMPIVDAIKMFIHQEELLHIYEKIPAKKPPGQASGPSVVPKKKRTTTRFSQTTE